MISSAHLRRKIRSGRRRRTDGITLFSRWKRAGSHMNTPFFLLLLFSFFPHPKMREWREEDREEVHLYALSTREEEEEEAQIHFFFFLLPPNPISALISPPGNVLGGNNTPPSTTTTVLYLLDAHSQCFREKREENGLTPSPLSSSSSAIITSSLFSFLPPPFHSQP